MGGPGSGRQPAAGRPPFVPAVSTKTEPLLEYIREGMSLKEACQLVGVSPTTIRKNVQAGQNDLDGGRQTLLSEFAVDVSRAMAEAKNMRINALNRAAEHPAFWAAAAWWLERRHPQEFGRQDRINMNMSGNLNLNAAADIDITESEADAIRSVLGKLGANERDSSQEESFGFEPSDEADDISLP